MRKWFADGRNGAPLPDDAVEALSWGFLNDISREIQASIQLVTTA